MRKPKPGEQVVCVKDFYWNNELCFELMRVYTIIEAWNDDIHEPQHQHVSIEVIRNPSRKMTEMVCVCMDFDDGVNQTEIEKSLLFNDYFIPLETK